MRFTPDELEYAISQYIDGTLPVLERDALDEVLARDAGARAILAEYQKLNTVVKSAPQPAVDWDAFGARLKGGLEEIDTPVRHFRIGSIGYVGRMAIAAALLCVVSIGIFVAKSGPTTSAGSIVVTGPQVETANITAVADISIGPSSAIMGQWYANEDVVTRPTVVLIDRAHASSPEDVY